jgi:hypothetical protein
MADDQRNHRHEHLREEAGSTRRHFLRRAGITGALAAAFVGAADAAGLGKALASTSRRCGHGILTCTYTPRQCNGGRPCSPGWCCYHCVGPCENVHTCIATGQCKSFTGCC